MSKVSILLLTFDHCLEFPLGTFPPKNVNYIVQKLNSPDHKSLIFEARKRIADACRKSIDGCIALVPSVEDEWISLGQMLAQNGADEVVYEKDPDLTKILHSAVQFIADKKNKVKQLEADCGLIGRSSSMHKVRKDIIQAVSDKEIPVLILGETGTGKRLVAEAIHNIDEFRKKHAFNVVDCGAVNETLMGSEFFGHVHGAFTGADQARKGAFQTAGSGTLLLDEVGELTPTMQGALLSVLQERRFKAVGSDFEYPIKCRIVSATNRNLRMMVQEGTFRSDLYYRLNGLQINLAPLADRKEDIPDLFSTLLKKYLPENIAPVFDSGVTKHLQMMDLPGNVRQLEMIARLWVSSSPYKNKVRLFQLPSQIDTTDIYSSEKSITSICPIKQMLGAGYKLKQITSECERIAVRTTIDMLSEGKSRTANFQDVAKVLDISKRSVYNKLNGETKIFI